MNIFLFTIAALASCFIVQEGYGADHSVSFAGHTVHISTTGNESVFKHQSSPQGSRFLTISEEVDDREGFHSESTTKIEIISGVTTGNKNTDRKPDEPKGKSCIADMEALRLELLFLFNPQSEEAHRNVTSFFLKNTVPQIMQDVQNYYPKSSFGIATYGDFDAWGGRGICYQLVVPLTTDLETYRQKTAKFQVTKGGRSPEVSFLALTYAATDEYMKWTQSDFSFFEKAKNNKPHVYKVILLITHDVSALPEPFFFDPFSSFDEFKVTRRYDRQSCRRVPLPTAVDVKNVFAKENVYFLGLINGDKKVMQFWQDHAQKMAPRGVVKSIHNVSRAAISQQLIKILTYELCSPTAPATKTSTTTPANRRRTRCSVTKPEKNSASSAPSSSAATKPSSSTTKPSSSTTKPSSSTTKPSSSTTKPSSSTAKLSSTAASSSTTKPSSSAPSSSKKHQNTSTNTRSATHTTSIAQPVTPLSRAAVTTSTLPPATISSTVSTLPVSTPTLIEVTPQRRACSATDQESCSSVAPKTSHTSSTTSSETQQSGTHDAKSKYSSTEAHSGTAVSDATCNEDDEDVEGAEAAGAQKKQNDTDSQPQTQSELNRTPRPSEASTTTDSEQHPAIITGAAGGAVGIVLLGGALAYYLTNNNAQKGNMDGNFEDVNKDGDFFSVDTQRETIVQLT